MPRAVQSIGQLGGLYTDYWPGPIGRGLLRRAGPGSLRALGHRFHADLERAPVKSFNLRFGVWELSSRWSANRNGSSKYHAYLETGRWFASAVARDLAGHAEFDEHATLFSYDTGALEAFEAARLRGARCVLGQMDPSRVEAELVREERALWPGWETLDAEIPDAFFARREREWELADVIVVNSRFCRNALSRQGVPEHKLCVVPLCYEPPPETAITGRIRDREDGRVLRVLFLGQVILRKGIQYLLEAARRLAGEPVRFDVVGPIGIARERLAAVPGNVVFHGGVQRCAVSGWYGRADLFVLPTISDGFALTQLEAMSHGLPVIATPNCGEVITDGVEGFVVPIRDADALARAVQRLVRDRRLLREQSLAAKAKSRNYTLRHLAEALAGLGDRPQLTVNKS